MPKAYENKGAYETHHWGIKALKNILCFANNTKSQGPVRPVIGKVTMAYEGQNEEKSVYTMMEK